MSSSPLYKLSSMLYLDTYRQCYKRILVLDREPQGTLSSYTKRIRRTKLSQFDVNECHNDYNKTCVYAIYDFENKQRMLTVDDVGELFSFLLINGYVIEERLSKLINENARLNNKDDFICFIR